MVMVGSQRTEITFLCILVSQQHNFFGISSQQLDWASERVSVGVGVLEGRCMGKCWIWCWVLLQRLACPFLRSLPSSMTSSAHGRFRLALEEDERKD